MLKTEIFNEKFMKLLQEFKLLVKCLIISTKSIHSPITKIMQARRFNCNFII